MSFDGRIEELNRQDAKIAKEEEREEVEKSKTLKLKQILI
jgi:hypothetical protein